MDLETRMDSMCAHLLSFHLLFFLSFQYPFFFLVSRRVHRKCIFDHNVYLFRIAHIPAIRPVLRVVSYILKKSSSYKKLDILLSVVYVHA
jgi:hypothetical protein